MSIAKRVVDSLKAVNQQRIAYPEWLLRTAEVQRWEVPALDLPQAQAELYQRLASVSTAVSTVANLGATSALNVKRRAGEKLLDVPNHDFERLMWRPNPLDSRSEFIIGTLSYLALTGNYYWYLNRTSATEAPLEVWLVPSWQIRPVPDGRMYLAGYEYDPGDGGQVVNGSAGNSGVHLRLKADLAGGVQGEDGAVERARNTAEPVVDASVRPIEADCHARDTGILESANSVGGQERSGAGRHGRAKPYAGAVAEQVEQVGTL